MIKNKNMTPQQVVQHNLEAYNTRNIEAFFHQKNNSLITYFI